MQKDNYFYLIHLQYLGYRYHGWFIQPDVKTIQLMVQKTINFVLNHDNFKILGSSRTDAMVSANMNAFELFTYEPIDTELFLKDFNYYLPSDIKALKIEEVDTKFNIIKSSKTKEYIYLFAHGEKFHPFCASMISIIRDKLDVDLMKEGAKLFLGTHNFKQYCTKPSLNTYFLRTIIHCEIIENTLYTANFFPEKSYILKISSKGFMRYQVRLIMGQLIRLGKGEITLDDIINSFSEEPKEALPYIAPASGLILNKIEFD